MKDYRIEVRVKNNILYKLMKGKGIETVAELSRLSGVSLPLLYNYMNLKKIPYSNEKHAKEGEFKNSVLMLAEYLEVTPYEMFPIQHLDKPLLTNKAESEMTFEEITQYILPVKTNLYLKMDCLNLNKKYLKMKNEIQSVKCLKL